MGAYNAQTAKTDLFAHSPLSRLEVFRTVLNIPVYVTLLTPPRLA